MKKWSIPDLIKTGVGSSSKTEDKPVMSGAPFKAYKSTHRELSYSSDDDGDVHTIDCRGCSLCNWISPPLEPEDVKQFHLDYTNAAHIEYEDGEIEAYYDALDEERGVIRDKAFKFRIDTKDFLDSLEFQQVVKDELKNHVNIVEVESKKKKKRSVAYRKKKCFKKKFNKRALARKLGRLNVELNVKAREQFVRAEREVKYMFDIEEDYDFKSVADRVYDDDVFADWPGLVHDVPLQQVNVDGISKRYILSAIGSWFAIMYWCNYSINIFMNLDWFSFVLMVCLYIKAGRFGFGVFKAEDLGLQRATWCVCHVCWMRDRFIYLLLLIVFVLLQSFSIYYHFTYTYKRIPTILDMVEIWIVYFSLVVVCLNFIRFRDPAHNYVPVMFRPRGVGEKSGIYNTIPGLDGFASATRLESLLGGLSNIMSAGAGNMMYIKSTRLVVDGVAAIMGLEKEDTDILKESIKVVPQAAVKSFAASALSLAVDCVTSKSLGPLQEPVPVSLFNYCEALRANLAAAPFMGSVEAEIAIRKSFALMIDKQRRMMLKNEFIDNQTTAAFRVAEYEYLAYIENDLNHGVTMKPSMYMVYGDGGLGKTRFCTLMRDLFLVKLCGEDVDVISRTACPPNGDKYDSVLTPRTIVIIHDDPLITKGTEARLPAAQLAEKMYGYSQGHGMSLLKAVAEEKGKFTTFPRLVMFSSNPIMCGIPVNLIADPPTLQRRMKSIRMYKPKEENLDKSKRVLRVEMNETKQPTIQELWKDVAIDVGECSGSDAKGWEFHAKETHFGWEAITRYIENESTSQVKRLLNPEGFGATKVVCRSCFNHGCTCKGLRPDMVEEPIENIVKKLKEELDEKMNLDSQLISVSGREQIAAFIGALSMQLTSLVNFSVPYSVLALFGSTLSMVLLPVIAWISFPSLLFIFVVDMCVLYFIKPFREMSQRLRYISDGITYMFADASSSLYHLGFLKLSKVYEWIAMRRVYFSSAKVKTDVQNMLFKKDVAIGVIVAALMVAIGAWIIWRRRHTDDDGQFSDSDSEGEWRRSKRKMKAHKDVQVPHVDYKSVGRVGLDDPDIKQKVEKEDDVVINAPLFEINHYKEFNEHEWKDLGTLSNIKLVKRQVPLVGNPDMFSKKSRTSTFENVFKTLPTRSMLVRCKVPGFNECSISQAIIVDPGVVQMTLHPAVPLVSGTTILNFHFRGEVVVTEVTLRPGDCSTKGHMDEYMSLGDQKGSNFTTVGDVLFVRVPMKSSISGIGYVVKDLPNSLVGVEVAIVDKRNDSVIRTRVIKHVGRLVYLNINVTCGGSGGSMWCNIGDKPVLCGTVSWNNVVETTTIISLYCVKDFENLDRGVYYGIKGMDAPIFPSEEISRSVNEYDYAFFGGVKRGFIVGVVPNVPKTRMKWEKFPLEVKLPENVSKVWPVRGFSGFVRDPNGQTKLEAVGSADGTPVVYVNPWATTHKYMNSSQVVSGVREDIEDEAIGLYCQFLLKANGYSKNMFRQVSIEEAAFGNNDFDGTNAKASAGLTLSGKVSDHIDKQKRWISPALRMQVEDIMSRLENGICVEPLSKAVPKQEVRPESKNLARVFYVSDLAYNIAQKEILANVTIWIAENGYRNGIMLRANAASVEFSNYLKPIHNKDVVVADSDQADFDLLQNARLQELVMKTFLVLEDMHRKIGIECSSLGARTVIASVGSTLMLVFRMIYYIRCGLLSGLYITAFLNSLISELLNFISLVTSSRYVDRAISVDHVYKYVRMGVLGDDNILFGSRQYLEHIGFTPAYIKLVCESYGLKVTAGDKGELGKDFMDKHELRFLKRLLDVVEDGGRKGNLQCSLPMNSIFKSLMWVDGSTPQLPIAIGSTISNAWRETLLLPEKDKIIAQELIEPLFDQFRDKYGFIPSKMSEEEFLEKYKSGEFVTFESA